VNLPFVLGARAVIVRLKTRALLALTLAFALLGALAAWAERGLAPRGALERTLLGVNLGWLLPLFAYLLFEQALGGRFEQIFLPVLRHGGSGRSAWLGALSVFSALLGAMGALLALLAVLLARGPSDASLLRELSQSVWIGAFAGVAYSAWLTLGSSVGKRGQGRIWVLLADLLLGGSETFSALFWPRAHIRNLLGGSAVLEIGQGTAALVLAFGTVFALLLAGVLARSRVPA
jgi:hypothetical protein